MLNYPKPREDIKVLGAAAGTMKNIASLLLCRELNQSPSGRFNRGFEQSAVNRWAEEDFLQHSCSEYVEFRPPPRSSIAAAFSPDGRYLASTHGDHTVKVTDVRTGRVIHSLAGHRRTPWVVRFSPVDSDLMASGSLDSTAAIWQVSTGQMLHKYDFGKPIASLAFDPSGTMLVVSAGHKVFSWPFTRLAPPVKILKTRRSLRALHFHPTAPHILLTAEVTERRAGTTADGVGTAAAMAATTQPPQHAHGQHRNLNRYQQQHRQQQAQVHSQLAWMHQAGGGGAGGGDGDFDLAHIGAPDESDPQEAVDDLAAFIAAHNIMAPSQQQQQQRQQSQQEVAQEPPAATAGPGASGARNVPNQGPVPWPTGLLRNLLMGVTGIFTGGGGGGAAGGGSAAGRGGTVNQQAADGTRVLRRTGSSPTRGGNAAAAAATAAAAAAAAGGGPYVATGAAFAGGGGAPSVNPGDGGVAWGNAHAGHSPPPGNIVTTATAPPAGGRLNVLAPADVIRRHNMGGGIRHAIPLVAPSAAAPLQPQALRGGMGQRLRDSHVAAYDLMWGWDHMQRMSESEIVRLRELALLAAPDLPSAANHDTPCIVTVRLWDFRDPTRELRKELLVLPRVVLCSEMGIHFTTCGRYMVCCVVRESPSEACLNWQAAQAVAAAQDTAATRTHAHPGVGGEGQVRDAYCACAGNLGEEDYDAAAGNCVGDMDDAEATHAAVGAVVVPAVTVAPAPGSPGSCQSVEMTDAEVRPRGPSLRDGGGERTVGWLGGGGGGEAQEYDDEYLYDTATQAFGQEPRDNMGSGAAESAGWRGPHSGGSDGGNGGAEGPVISALSLQQRQQQQRYQEVHVRQQLHQHYDQHHTEDVEEARTEVSRPGAAAWEMEYDSATAAAYRKIASAASAVSGVARDCAGSGGGAEEADGEGGEVRPYGAIRPSTSLSHLGGAGVGLHLNHQQHQLHLVQSVNAVANKLSTHDPQLSRGGAGPSAAAPKVLGGDPAGRNPVHDRSRIPHETQRPERQQPMRYAQRRHHNHQHQYDQQYQQQPIRWQHHQQQQAVNAIGRAADRQPWPEGPRGQGGLSRTGWSPAGPAAAAANAAPHCGGDSDAGLVHEGGAATASVGPPQMVQETPSTFASIKAHLALQRSRDGGATAGGRGVSRDAGRAGGTVAGPVAQHVAAATAPAAGVPTATTAATSGAPAAAAVGTGATQRNDAPTVAPGTAPVTGGPTATAAAAAAQPSSSYRPCYELCIFYTGTSPIPPTPAALADSVTATANVTTSTAAAAAAPSASSSVAFPMAPGLAATGALPLAGAGGSGASTTSVIGPHFGALLHARPVLAAHCMTSVQLSPAGDHVLVAYGRRHISLCSLVACTGQLAVVHSVVEIYSVPDLILRRVLLSADDEVNVAVFNAFPAEGMAYGTKEGRLRLIRYDRRPPLRSAIPFLPTPPHLDDEAWEAEHPELQQQDSGKSMSVSEGEQQRPAV